MKKIFSDNNLLDDANDNATTIMPIFAEVEGNPDIECPGVAEVDLPILPLRNMVMYPGVALPVSVGRAKSLQLIKEAYAQKQYIGVTCQKDMYVDEPEYKDLYEIGTIAEIVKILEMPDGSTTVILQGKRRFHLDNLTTFTPYLRGNISLLEEKMPKSNDKEFEALISAIKDMTFNILKTLGEPSRELMFALRNIENSHYLINFLCSNIPLNTQQKQDLLNIDSVKQRAFSLYTALSKEAQLIEIKASIQSRTREDLNQQQREHFLQQQIKTIQDELGGSVQEQDTETEGKSF